MSNYSKSTNFATKDNLSPGNPLKIVKGTEIDTEFNNIATAVATKTDNSSATITGGTINGAVIGGTTAAAGTFTNLTVSTAATIASAAISAGTINGAVIGGSSPLAITGTNITANTGFSGPLTGAVTGNVTGNLTGNVTGNVTGNITGNVTGNVTAATGTSTFNNVTISGSLDMDSATSATITGLASPTNDSDAATKGYVDALAQGIDAKASVVAATTANITLSGAQTIDGISIVAGDRVLVKDQSTQSANGIYLCATGSWTRTTDADTYAELVAAFTFVEKGTTNADSGFICTIDAGGTLGSTSITWAQFSGAGQITAGDGLTKTGNTLNVGTASSSRIVVNGDNIDLASSGVTPGTYQSVTFDTYGRATAGTNPTTIAGYNITNAYTKTEIDSIFGSTTAAATSASNAATSASNASTSASNASTSASNAATSETNAAASYDAFDDRYLGSKSSAPSVDNDGNALLTGALYWNNSVNTLYVWTGSAWTQAAFTASGFATLTGVETLTNKTLTAPTLTAPVLGTPASGTVTNLTGTASININGTVGATTASTGAFTTLSATGVTTVQAGSAAAPAITTSGDTNTGIFFPAADTIAFSEGGAESMRIDSSGNLGLGVTPSAWSGTYYKVLEGGDANSQSAVGFRQDINGIDLYTNTVLDSGGNKYKFTGASGRFSIEANTFFWQQAASGTAGNAITFTQAMTLDASGRLGIGPTSPTTILDIGLNDSTPKTIALRYSSVPTYLSSTFDGTSGLSTFSTNSYNTSSGSASWSAFANSGYASSAIQLGTTVGGSDIRFLTASASNTVPTERARITAAGGLVVGTTTDPGNGIIADINGNVRKVPQSGSSKTSSYTLATTDIGEYILLGASGAIVIPDATFSAGDVITIFNNTASTATITCSITTAYIAGTFTDKATMTLAAAGVATVLFISGTLCVVSGNVT